MRIEPLGDLACILRGLDASPAALAHAIEAAGIAGVTDVVPCAATVGVYFGAAPTPIRALRSACRTVANIPFVSRLHTIPVCYEFGRDLDAVSVMLGMSSDRLVAAHVGAEYACFAVGFCPGFAYLGPLPDALRGVPRLSSPRTQTEPGSVGLTGNQTAVYPLQRPGGWPIIGKTPLELVNVEELYFPIAVGDRVRFSAISASDFDALRGARL